MPKGVYPRTKEHFELLNKARKTRKSWIPWNKGKKCPQLHGRKKGTKVPSMQGDNNPSKCPEVRKKISKKLIGRKVPTIVGEKNPAKRSEVRKKISQTLSGRKLSEETKEKLRERRLYQVFPSKDTSIELRVQNALKEKHILFETHVPILGQPDIFIEPNICIFCDGNYWHCLPGRREYDTRVTHQLMKQGYTVLRFSESEINNNLEEVIRTIMLSMPLEPVEMRPLLVEIPASLVVEAGTGCLRLQS